ncbi:hypothetical protein EUTSA_v10001169mg [Eutrema salsugineum]|uniref:Cyclic nucleotide-binding domain-containing protein n=1 Tax=Eutrema salsugineum TaxID=72664 RepID=V4LIZ8_EUTSA|nr:hypothetical protein EUTSA_v10001169mg [Eutrema salsugineum]
MLSHICLKFKTEGLKQQETLNNLPKAIRSSIANYLFLPIVQNIYLFQGVSRDFLFQLVSDIDAEHFPPKEDIILQNEAPTDLYIFVSRAVLLTLCNLLQDFTACVDGHDQIQGKAVIGNTFGEIRVLCYRPQPFTVRITELSQILRISKTFLMSAMHAHSKDGRVIMKNLFMKPKGQQSIAIEGTNNDQENRDFQRMGWEEWRMESRKDGKKGALMDAIHRGDTDMSEKATGGISNSETKERSYNYDSDQYCSSSIQIMPCKRKGKRVTIHMLSQDQKDLSQRQNGKLILLPSSIEELLRLAMYNRPKIGECNFTKTTNAEKAEIDDLDVIWDGDDLFFSSNSSLSPTNAAFAVGND